MNDSLKNDLYSWLDDVRKGDLYVDEAIALIQARLQDQTRELVDSITLDALERPNLDGMRMSLQQARQDVGLEERAPLTPAEEATELLGEDPELGGISE
jgi:hypothetical protein